MEIIDGKLVSKTIREDLKQHVGQMKVKPVLSCIIVGDDPASEIYVRNKVKACEEVGIESIVYTLRDDISQEELDLTLSEAVRESDGVIVQRPLPNHLNTKYLEHYPEKDVDGFTEQNLGVMCKGNDCHIPATPLGILMLINYYHIDVENKNVVVQKLLEDRFQYFCQVNLTMVTLQWFTRALQKRISIIIF